MSVAIGRVDALNKAVLNRRNASCLLYSHLPLTMFTPVSAMFFFAATRPIMTMFFLTILQRRKHRRGTESLPHSSI